MAHTTLILGAGMGKEIGFPDGPELKDLIIKHLQDHERELKDIIQWTTEQTVDEIAATYQNHANRIRQLVTKILWNAENESALSTNGKTYKLMLNQIQTAQSKGDSVTIGTFNYDRSLPYLIHRINSLKPKESHIQSQLKHIYGRLAPLYFEDTEIEQRRSRFYHEYGKGINAFRLNSLPKDEKAERIFSIERELFGRSNISFIGESNGKKEGIDEDLKKSESNIFFWVWETHPRKIWPATWDFESSNRTITPEPELNK